MKQVPRAWNNHIDKYFLENDFNKCLHEHALYVKIKGEDILIVCLYMDDLIFTGSNPSMFEEFKRVMTKEFEMTDIELMAYYLGIEVISKRRKAFSFPKKAIPTTPKDTFHVTTFHVDHAS